jgi:hypothetical protein
LVYLFVLTLSWVLLLLLLLLLYFRFDCSGFLLVTMMGLFRNHAGTIEGGMETDLDGRLVVDNRSNAMLCSSCCNMLGAHGSNSECHHPNRPAQCHGTHHITLPRIMRRTQFLQVLFDNLSLLSGIVNCGRGHANPNHANAQGKRDRKTGYGSGSRRPRDETGVVLPFPLELFRVQLRAFLVVLFKIERHFDGCTQAKLPKAK